AFGDIGASPQQEADAIEMATLGGEMEERHVPWAAGDAELARMGTQKIIERTRFAGDRSRDHLAVDAQGIDLGLERPPARKTIVARDLELGPVQGGRRLALTQAREMFLGGLLQPIEVGLLGERLHHDVPSSSAPGSAAHGQERRNDEKVRSQAGSTLYAD